MVPSNPNLLIREAAVALSAAAFVLTVSLLFNAPLGAPANPGLSSNPTKAPWYFAGVQEMLVHFHPTFALLIVLALSLGVFFQIPLTTNACRIILRSSSRSMQSALSAGMGFSGPTSAM